MKNLDKAFMPGYITTSLNGEIIEVAEAEQRMVGNKTVLRTYKK